MRDLKGMVVVITGASAGIGKALAEELASRGAKLALAARRAEKLEALNHSLGGSHLIVPTDVAERAQCEALISRAVGQFGRLDTLVCNAGFGILKTVAEATPEEIERQFRTNFNGTHDCIRPTIPIFAKQEARDGWRGQIMIVSSIVARRGIPYFGVYSATKAAQLSMAEAMRVELKTQQIAVTTVHPIGTDTEFTEAYQREGNSKARIAVSKGEPRQTPQDVARAMVKAIERPRPEVWPYRISRWGIGLATLFPSMVDGIMTKRVVREE